MGRWHGSVGVLAGPALAAALVGASCGGGDGDDDDTASDAAVVFDAVPPDAAPLPAPSMSIELERADSATALPPAAAIVTVRDIDGVPWEGAVTIEATNPDGAFSPGISAVEALGGGRYRAVVTAARSGEVAIDASATVDGTPVGARAVAVFLPYVAADWGIPRALHELNTPGHEDSVGVSPDGETVFFAYSPIAGCDYTPAGFGDPPDKTECRELFGPYADAKRPCSHGLGGDDLVTLGLFGDTGAWPWPKSLFSSYAASRRPDGSFRNPVCLSFDDDGIVQEVGPSSGPVNPTAGSSYPLFFGYPDWLDVDPARDGTIYAVAMVPAGQSVDLSDPITAVSSPPAAVLAQSLTGDLNLVRASADQIGEFRVFHNDVAGRYELYFERRETAGSTHDVMMSPLEGTFPVGDWGAAVPVPGMVNTDTRGEGFPWPVMLPGDELALFYDSFPNELLTEQSRVMKSTWTGGEWGAPTMVIEVTPNGAAGGVLLTALPSVAVGSRGVEMFFVYVIIHEGGALDFQLGVVPRP